MNFHSKQIPGLEYGRKSAGAGDDALVTRELNRILGEVKAFAGSARQEIQEQNSRLTDVEQKLARRAGPGGPAVEPTPGELLIASDDFKALAKTASQRGKVAIQVKAVTTMTSAVGSSGALIAPDYRPDAVMLPRRRMTIRSLLAPGETEGSSVQYPRQTVRNLNAANVAETLLKPQSEIDFELVTAPVQTTAHFMVASRQVMDDAPQLRSLVDGEMRYGLDLVEEAGFLYGDGTGVNFLGIAPQAQAYNPAFNPTGATAIDVLALALLQSELALLPATGIVLHPTDWRRILLTKDGMGRYIMGDPLGQTEASIWGIPVVPTLAMAAGKFLVGAFRDGAQVFDRMEAEVLISSEDSDNFKRNLLTIRAERRAAMTVRRPQAFVYGSFPTS